MPSLFHPPRSHRREILDLRPATTAEVEANFDEIARVNRFLGGISAVRNALRMLASQEDTSDSTLRLLDICAGGADIDRALIADARRGFFGRSRTFHITATDIHAEILAHALRQTPPEQYPEITIETADALALPYPDGAFDYALCSMALHHFDPEQAVRVLREMARVSRRGLVVNDLRRSVLASVLIRVLSTVLRAHPITRHDAPLSVLRAYTPEELRGLMGQAGLSDGAFVRRAFSFRMAGCWRRETPISGNGRAAAQVEPNRDTNLKRATNAPGESG